MFSMDNQEKRYQRLLQISAQLMATLDQQEVEQTTISLLPAAFQSNCGAIVRLGPEREQGKVWAHCPAGELSAAALTAEESVALLPILAERSSRLIRRGEGAPGLERFLERLEVTSALVYALPTTEGLPPLLCLGFPQPSPPLTPEERLLWESLGRQVASALNSALLYQETRGRFKELRLLHEVAMATSTTVDIDRILHRVVDALWHNLSPDICSVLIVDRSEGTLQGHPASRGLPFPPQELVIPIGEGISGWTAQTGQALLIPDVTHDPRYVPIGIESIHSEICVPVQVAGRIEAVLNLESRQPDAFKGEDIRLVATVASQLAVAIERSRIFQQAQQRVRELTALMRISATMQQATRLEEILDRAMGEAFSLVGQELALVLLLDRQQDCLRVAASRGLPDEVVETLNLEGIPSTFGTFDIVLRTGEMLEIPDTANDPRVERGYGPVPEQLTNIPLKTDKGIIGLIVLDGLPLDDASRRLLQAIANMAAMAIERAWLFEETRRRLEEVRFLQEVALAATSTLDFDEVLRRSVEALQRWLDFEVFGFLIVEERDRVLRLHPDFFVGIPKALHGFSIPIGEGITGWVAQTGQPYLCPDVRSDPHYRNAIPEIRSEVCVPVKVEERVIAVIDLESERPAAFGPNELRLLSSMAHQLAMALENARLYQQERRQRCLAEAMRQAAVALGTTRDLEALLDKSLHHLEKLLPYQTAFVVLLEGERVKYVYGQGGDPPPPEQWLAPGTLGARIYAEHRALVLPDIDQDPTWQPWPHLETLRSWIGVPFLNRQEVNGMLLIGATEANTYDREQATLAFSFAGQLALGIERARFYEQERRRAEQLDLLNQIGQRIVALIEVEDLREEALRCLQEGLKPNQSRFILFEGEEMAVWTSSQGDGAPSYSRRPVPSKDMALVCWVANKGVPLLVPDITIDPRFQKKGEPLNVRAEMAVPLRVKDEVIGVLDAQSDRVGQFGEADLSTLQAIASQVSGALERARLYTELRDSVRQLKETDQLRRDFLSTINHEMRAPLTAILGFTDFLLRAQAGPLTHAQEEYLGDIRAAGERILNLVENVLEAARLEDGKVVPRYLPVQIEELIDRTQSIVQAAAMEKALTLTAEIAPDLPMVWADPMMVERILINLLWNAVKFTPPGGKVWVEAAESKEFPDMVEVRVCDTGVGIDPAHFDDIFQRYRRLETPAVGQVGGTGLGLYIVQGLVQAHDGEIWVESTEGEGSTFTFTLPIVPEDRT